MKLAVCLSIAGLLLIVSVLIGLIGVWPTVGLGVAGLIFFVAYIIYSEEAKSRW